MQEYERLLTSIRKLVIEMEVKSKRERCGYLTSKGICTFKGKCHKWIEGEGCSKRDILPP